MKNLQNIQYIIMLVLLALGIYVGYTVHKPKAVITDCSKEVNQWMIQSDSLSYVITALRDSLDEKRKHDTIFITKKYEKEINRIKHLSIDSSIEFFTNSIAFSNYTEW